MIVVESMHVPTQQDMKDPVKNEIDRIIPNLGQMANKFMADWSKIMLFGYLYMTLK